ncbi:cupin domain-containing protein [Methylocystis sp. H4A]|uniref:cupin domain-containing protein n=1 Tax=Methylocystis sp. H4A TaxID=2785788 RepID=UPI0018C230DD|nr:cupin domain-containing protein [Methylocystis sp. H4A]MBG0802138.1 cupin domain-containing protein [Methylocystis sp. H4A]
MTTGLSTQEVVRLLDLAPHPEGGFYRQTFRDPCSAGPGGRAASTAIYYLLPGGGISHWHRVDAAEVWHFYAGAALELKIASPGAPTEVLRLGAELAAGEQPQAVVPVGVWQSAKSLGQGPDEWTLVGCTVAPGFEFAGFELAPADFSPDVPA